jgi:outer membrane protein
MRTQFSADYIISTFGFDLRQGQATAVASAAKTTFEAALTDYRSGVGSITDATVAQSQLPQARNASTDTYSTAQSAAATLALAAGSLGAPPQ